MAKEVTNMEETVKSFAKAAGIAIFFTAMAVVSIRLIAYVLTLIV